MLGHSILLVNMDCRVIKQINELNDNCQEVHLYFVLIISVNRQASVLTISYVKSQFQKTAVVQAPPHHSPDFIFIWRPCFLRCCPQTMEHFAFGTSQLHFHRHFQEVSQNLPVWNCPWYYYWLIVFIVLFVHACTLVVFVVFMYTCSMYMICNFLVAPRNRLA